MLAKRLSIYQWWQKETQKSDLKFLELPQTLLFISQYCDSFVILLLLEMGRQGIKKTLLWNPSPALGFWHYTSRQREGHQNEPFFSLWIPKWPASVYSQQCQHIINRKGNENYWNDHLRENFMIFCQILSTNSLSKCIEISLENSNRNSGTQILLKSPIPWDWHLSLNTYNSINNSNII